MPLSGFCHGGTIFQDTRKPLRMWFRAAWHITSQKNGASAVSLQQELGLGSYITAWTWLHKLRRAMVRSGRDRLRGTVEVDEAYWGGEEEDANGRLTEDKAVIAVAAEEDGKGIGRIRLRSIPDVTRASLHGFIAEVIEPGKHGTDRRMERLPGIGEVRSRPASTTPPPRGRAFAAPSSPGGIVAQAMVAGHPSRRLSVIRIWITISTIYVSINRRTSASRGKLFYAFCNKQCKSIRRRTRTSSEETQPQSVVAGGVN